ncbi:MAG: hypothetical protein EZS28_041930, partial [Streblomastix strix]
MAYNKAGCFKELDTAEAKKDQTNGQPFQFYENEIVNYVDIHPLYNQPDAHELNANRDQQIGGKKSDLIDTTPTKEKQYYSYFSGENVHVRGLKKKFIAYRTSSAEEKQTSTLSKQQIYKQLVNSQSTSSVGEPQQQPTEPYVPMTETERQPDSIQTFDAQQNSISQLESNRPPKYNYQSQSQTGTPRQPQQVTLNQQSYSLRDVHSQPQTQYGQHKQLDQPQAIKPQPQQKQPQPKQPSTMTPVSSLHKLQQYSSDSAHPQDSNIDSPKNPPSQQDELIDSPGFAPIKKRQAAKAPKRTSHQTDKDSD